MKFLKKTNSLKKFDFIAVLVFSLLFYISLLNEYNTNGFFTIKPLNLIYKLFIFIFIFSALTLILVFFNNMKFNVTYYHTKKIHIIYYALPCILIWGIYLLSFYPAILTFDSFDQYSQAVIGKYSDWHPIIHTLLIKLMLSIFKSFSSIALLQIIVLSFIFGYTMYSLEKLNINRTLLFLATILFALCPVNGILTITMWKDIFYSSFLLLYTTIIINIISSNCIWLKKPFNLFLYIFTSVNILSFRHNGILVIIGTFIFLCICYRTKIKIILFSNLVSVILFFAIQFSLFSIFNVSKTPSTEALGIPLQQIAAIVKFDGNITESQKNQLSKIIPLSEIKNTYDAFIVNPLKFNENFNGGEIIDHKADFLKLWFELIKQNPKISINSYLAQTAMVWSINNTGYIYTYENNIVDNIYGLNLNSKIPKVKNILNYGLNQTLRKGLINIFWRPALPLFLILFCAYLSIRRKFFKPILATLPILLNSLSLLIAIPAQDYRYLYSTFLVTLPLIIFLCFKNKECNLKI